jgi:hypothetical protein
MARGDQIYVLRPFAAMQGIYEHHGIDCGDGSVIHYRKPDDQDATISRTSLGAFAQGQRIAVKRYTTCLIPEDVVQRAESRLGEQQYDLLTNNCEHFANWCKTGYAHSTQLARFGLGTAGFSLPDFQQLLKHVQGSQHQEASHRLMHQALDNIAIARQTIQPQYETAIAEMQDWDRTARFALRKGREDLARAALTRKVAAKQRWSQLKGQLDQLTAMQQDLTQNLPT